MNDQRDRKKRRPHSLEHDSHQFVRVRSDEDTVDKVTAASRETQLGDADMIEIEELPRYADDVPDVDTATHAPFIHKMRTDPELPARLADLDVLWHRIQGVRGEQRRGRRETERQVSGVSDAAKAVMEFQFKVRILWAAAVFAVLTGGGSALAVVHGLQESAAATATAEYRLRVAEDLVKDMAPRLRAAEETARLFALRLEELGRAVGHNQPRTTP